VSERANELAGAAGHPARAMALSALPDLGDDRSLGVLLAASFEKDEEVAVEALPGLRRLLEGRPGLRGQARAVEPLVDSPSETVARLAYEVLALSPKPEADAERVRRALATAPPKIRWGALELAAALGEAAPVARIAELLREPDGMKAAEVLFRIAPRTAAAELSRIFEHCPILAEDWIRYLAEEDPEAAEAFRPGLEAAVRGAPEERLDDLLRAAADLEADFDAEVLARAAAAKDWTDRDDAFRRIGSARTPAGLEVLRAGLRDPERWVRATAAKAAGRARAAACRDELLALLKSDAHVREDAIEALGRLGDRSVLAGLLPHLADPKVGKAVVEAFRALGRAEDAERLLDVARDAEDVGVRSLAVDVAAGLLGDGALERLRSLVEVRRLRAGALEEPAERGDAVAAASAARHLADSDPRVVRAAAKLLGEARQAAAVPALVGLLAEKDVRGAAVTALGRMPRGDVGPALAALLKSRDAGLREAAATALDAADAEELVGEVGELLGDDAPRLAAIGVRVVRRRPLRDRLDEVERLSRRPDPALKRAALATLAELDWAGRRDRFLERLKAREDGFATSLAPLFAARGDAEALRILVSFVDEGSDVGYDVMTVLNGFRNPAAYARSVARVHSGIGTVPGRKPAEKARALARELGIPLRLEPAPAAFPRASFEAAFGTERHSAVRAGGGGGRFWRQSGSYGALEKIREGMGKDLVPVVEDDAIRLLPREKALEFWKAWAAEKR
jgi:HEAT repeat protein